jgi:hypothetical protein
MTAPRIMTRENAAGFLDPQVEPALWTALIPAAGRGSRLGFDLPKILFPIAGATILEWLVHLLKPLSSRFVLVLSPEGAGLVEKTASSCWAIARPSPCRSNLWAWPTRWSAASRWWKQSIH